MSHVVDALIEFAKRAYQDILVGQGSLQNPFFEVVRGTTQRVGAAYGIPLLRFSNGEGTHCYVDKSGILDPADYVEKMGDRFLSVSSWQVEGNHKAAPIPDDYSRSFFKQNSVCYFPSARHERPHWLNLEGVKDEPILYFAENYADRLYKPVVFESAARENKQWLLDVLFDSRAEVQTVKIGNPPELRFRILNAQDLLLLQTSRTNVETVLRSVLQDDSARLVPNYRTISPYRLSIQTSSRLVPSLDHLSSGQLNLFNLFATVIR